MDGSHKNLEGSHKNKVADPRKLKSLAGCYNYKGNELAMGHVRHLRKKFFALTELSVSKF